jgi:phosphatidylinositol alpha-1,6-mannosyltransferase
MASFRHVLVTNDFPPKVGGIQTYLYEIYRRLDPDSYTVITTTFPGDVEFDNAFPGEVIRLRNRLLPDPLTRRQVFQLCAELDPDLVVFDPIWPAGELAMAVSRPYALIAHGAEVKIPAAIPWLGRRMQRIIANSRGVISAGRYVADLISQLSPNAEQILIPPGIDLDIFRPSLERGRLREELMLDPSRKLILFVSRLVPRKGADTLLRSIGFSKDGDKQFEVHIVGDGRYRARLESLAMASGAPVVFHGKVSESRKIELYQAADLFVMPVRTRWFGLEEEGFGIVFLEAQACGLKVIASRSGGVAEAVDPVSGILLDRADSRSLWSVLGPAITEASGGLERPRDFVSQSYDLKYLAANYAQAIVSFADMK